MDILYTTTPNEINAALLFSQFKLTLDGGFNYLQHYDIMAIVPKANLNLFTQKKSQINIPIVTIVSITLKYTPLVIQADADNIAVRKPIFNATDISGSTQSLSNFFN